MQTSVADQLVLWHRWLPRRGGAGESEDTEIAAWCKTIATRFEVGGGLLLARIGGTVAAAFDPSDCVDAIELSLDLLDEADAAEIEVTIGLALGPLSEQDGHRIGPAIERAQQLANRARGGELVLGSGVRKEVQDEFLFGRRVAGTWRGTTIDRKNPRRIESADAIALLAPATFPSIGGGVVADMGTHLEAGSARTFVLRGPVGSGAHELVAVLAAELGHSNVFSFAAAPGGVVPLASLRVALLRRFGSPEGLARQVSSAGCTGATAQTLRSVAAGELAPLSELAMAMAALLAPDEDGAIPWLMLRPLSLIDAATLAVLLEARTLTDFVIFARLPTETPLPRPLANLDEPVVEHVVPPLKTSDARIVAEEILGRQTDADVARRIAVLGGDTMIGVVEAARTLIATGELVRGDADGFVWRSGPRSGADMISTEALISERIDLLGTEARQVLEALCVAPDGSSRHVLEAIAARDAIGPATFDASLERLLNEAFTQGEVRPSPTSSLLRWRVLELIPAARSMELHRFVGEALAASPTPNAPHLTQLGYFLIEGGQEGEGRVLVTSVMERLVEAGYRRAAQHLSGWLATASADPNEGAAPRATPVPPPAEARDEAPPSNEVALGKLLDEIAQPDRLTDSEPLKTVAAKLSAVRRPKPPPPRRSAPKPPNRRAPPPPPSASSLLVSQPVTDQHQILELSVDEMEFFQESSIPIDEELVLTVSEPPQTEDIQLLDIEIDFDPGHEGRASSGPPAELPAGILAPEPEPEPVREEPDSDATMLNDAAELMAALRSQRLAKAAAAAEEPVARAPDVTDGAQTSEPDPPTDPPTMEMTAAPPEARKRSFGGKAAAAIRAGNFAGLERMLERRIAEGGDLVAIKRVRAVALLAKGDVAKARKSLEDAQARGHDDPADQARFDVAMALLNLRSGQALEGVRQGLSALANSRSLADARGEEAALKTIAACFRALGMDERAQRLERS